MKYWVLSPNVWNDNTEEEWKRAVKSSHHAYLGYKEGTPLANKFKKEVKVSDLILIAQGANTNKVSYLCGVVDGEARREHKKNTPGLAQNRPLVDCLSAEELKGFNLDFEGCAYGDSKQPSALYELKPTKNNCDLKLVKTLLVEIQKKRHKTTMANIKVFSEQRKQELQGLWNKFKDSFASEEKEALEIEIKDLLGYWGRYKDLIKEDKLDLKDYTNLVTNDGAGLPGGYLCNFLERTTASVFGSSKPGNALNFGIKMNADGKTFTIKKYLKKGEKSNEYLEADPELDNEFRKISDVFKEIIESSEALSKANTVELVSYSAKQIIRKLAVLDNLNDFLFIYSDDFIDALHSEFVSSAEGSNLVKNYEVRRVLNEVLELSEISDLDNVLLSQFILKYANTKGLADDNTPNVILYGPPGTGKTYAVKQSLEFLCQGDRNRYEFVQFHPSFSYEDFIDGIKPKGVSKDGNMQFELVDGIFKRFCKRANENREKNYYFVVDEINRANLSSVFGETLVCLEKDYRHSSKDSPDNLIKTQYSPLIEAMIEDDDKNKSLAYVYKDENAYFGVPSNLFFIGMMNDVDKSIDAFDLALRRRFKWIRKDCDYQVIENEVKFKNGNENFTNIGDYEKACRKINNYISERLGMGSSYEFGHSFFMKITGIAKFKTISKQNLKDLFELHLKPTLKEYLRSIFSESELDAKLNEALAEFVEPIKSHNEN